MFCQSCGKLSYKGGFLTDFNGKDWCTTPACLQAALQAGVPKLAIEAATVFGERDDTGETGDTEEHDSAVDSGSDTDGDVRIKQGLGRRYNGREKI